MDSTLTRLSNRSLHRLPEALNSGLLTSPFSSLTLAQLVPQEQSHSLLDELRGLQQLGLTSPLLAGLIRILLQQREQLRVETGRLELVMIGPEPPESMIRDTGVVVRIAQNGTPVRRS